MSENKNIIKKGFLIKHKLILLIILPLLLLLFFLNKETNHIDQQILSLEKAKSTVDFLDMMFYEDIDHKKIKETGTHHNHDNHNHEKSEESWNEIENNINKMFPKDIASEFKVGLLDFRKSIETMESAKNPEESLSLFKHHVDTHRNLLMGVEKVHYEELILEIDSQLKALYQLEWLMFWAQEEGVYNRLLLEKKYTESTQNIIINEIRLLIQNQYLFLNRFIAISRDKEQNKLLMTAFEQDELNNISILETNLFDGTPNKEILDEIQSASRMNETSLKLKKLNDIAHEVEHNLLLKINLTITTFKNKKNTFILTSILSILIVFLLAVHIALRLTNNLRSVLIFLSRSDEEKDNFLFEIKGTDELSQFAREVKKLTEKEKNQRNALLNAKENSEIARNNAIEASKAKSTFLANMSHEIRTPLNGVIGMIEVLGDTSLTTTQKDYINTIETSSHLLLTLINDILDFSKIESGMLLINPHATAVRESVYDVAAVVQSKVKEKQISLKVEIDKSVPQRVLIDDHRLRQILMNLMSNAVKFTNKGSVSIGVHKIRTANNKKTLRFSVKDTGIGIDESRQNKIFDSFAQEDDSVSKQFGGTGLGLAISSQLVELMGGQIQIESKKGSGSLFFFDLPLEEEKINNLNHKYKDISIILVGSEIDKVACVHQELDFYKINVEDHFEKIEEIKSIKENQLIILIEDEKEEPVELHEKIIKIKKENRKNLKICLIRDIHSVPFDFNNDIDGLVNYPLLGERLLKVIQQNTREVQIDEDQEKEYRSHVLIAEDNLVNQKVASLHLKKANCSFDVANNGIEVFEIYKSNPEKYDFILMDYMMPLKNGLEATKEIRAFEEKEGLTQVPIVALTASIVNDDVDLFYNAGMNDYLPKPFNSVELNDKINKIMKQQQEIIEKEDGELSQKQDERLILIVEDNIINQKVAGLLLSKAGFEYEIAGDGQIAVDAYRSSSSKYSLVLMDCMMPNKDGFEATQEIRAFEELKGLSRIPIIALTASIVDDDIQNCFDSGMDAYMPKPIKKEKLLSEIEKRLNLSKVN